jgi:hypothetical protein
MLRRPSRTALHSALSALAGGLRGTAMQREQQQQQEYQQQMMAQRDEDRRLRDEGFRLSQESTALRDALALAGAGAVRATPEAELPAGTRVRYRDEDYVIPPPPPPVARPTLQEQQAMRSQEFDEANRRAYGALQLTYPQMATGGYNPNVDYKMALGESGKAMEAAQPAPPTSAEVTAQRNVEAQQARRLAARAWYANTVQQLGDDVNAKNAFGRMYEAIARQLPPGSDPEDVLVAMQAASQGQARMEGIEASTALTRARTRAQEAELEGSAMPLPPPGAPAPMVRAAPAPAPVTSPAAPARPTWQDDDYDAAFDVLGADASDQDVLAWLMANRPRR